MNLRPDNHGKGFSLVEMMIATVIIGLVSVSIITAIGYSSRATRINSNAMAAKNIAQSYIEKMNVDLFTSVTAQYYTDISETPVEDETPKDIVWLDEGLGIRCGVSFRFKGFGRATNSCSANVIKANLAGEDWHTPWKANEWAGDTLYLVAGKGMGHFAKIRSNTGDTLTLAESLPIAPDATTKYMINNGKTVEITTTWHYKGREEPYTATVESLVVNYKSVSDFGF